METMMANYVQSDDDWTITVSGPEAERSAKAPGIIAARDRADQLVEELKSADRPTVVHLLNGSALDFTEAYMTARLTLPETTPLEVPPPGSGKPAEAAKTSEAAEASQVKDEETEPAKAEEKPPIPQGKQLPKAIEPRKPSEVGGQPMAAKQAADVVKPPAAAVGP